MGARGPKPGMWKMRPMPASSPVFAKSATGGTRHTIGAPSMPKHLGKPARVVWKRTVTEMEKAGTLTHADRDILAAYCVAVADLETLSARIDADGLMIDTPTVDRNGKLTGQTVLKMHPALKWRADLLNKVKQLAGELGLTPAARSRVTPTGEAAGKKPNAVAAIRDRIQAARANASTATAG
ncbi:MAG: phage terminase small subunit P27 family [Planctomycetes bacterium]|nr:phage terminase small subunit P27 family [Planctomycetota bacterium]